MDTWAVPDVILPVLNERGALPWVLSRMPAGYRPIVADNGSTDGSGDLARELGAQVVFEPIPGFGAACFAGLRAATDDIVCFMDCDGSLDPEELPGLAAPVIHGQADLALGERIPDHGAWPVHARVANRLLAWEVRRRTALRIADMGPMRVTRREPLLALGIQDRRFGWPLEMVLRAAAAEWQIVGAPVPYHTRTGRSKVTGTVRGTMRAVRDMSRVMR